MYLGRRKSISSGRFFSLRNYKLHLDDMVDLNLDTGGLAARMAETLAVMHWDAKNDASDIEFVMGASYAPRVDSPDSPPQRNPGDVSSEPDTLVRMQLWCLDFDRVKGITMDEAGVDDAVRAFHLNDPYYPRPGPTEAEQYAWQVFVKNYLRMSSRVVSENNEADSVRKLPALFIEKLTVRLGVLEEQRKASLAHLEQEDHYYC